jgi:hypothetical protein
MFVTGIDEITTPWATLTINSEIVMIFQILSGILLILSCVGIFLILQRIISKTNIHHKKKFKKFVDDKEFTNINEILYYCVDNTPLDYLAYYNKTKDDYLHETNPKIVERMVDQGITRNYKQQNERYKNIAKKLHDIIDLVNHEFEELGQGILIRTIFDVKKGGVFYYHISDDEYIFGATVDQDNMNNNSADNLLRNITKKIKKLNGL